MTCGGEGDRDLSTHEGEHGGERKKYRGPRCWKLILATERELSAQRAKQHRAIRAIAKTRGSDLDHTRSPLATTTMSGGSLRQCSRDRTDCGSFEATTGAIHVVRAASSASDHA